MANNNQLNIEIKVNRKELADAKADLKNFTNELKIYSKAEVEQIKANAKVKVSEERTALEKIKGVNQSASAEKKNILQKELIDYKENLRQKIQAERDAQNQLRGQQRQEQRQNTAQQNQNSKFTGDTNRPFAPTSLAGLKQQEQYYRQFLSTLSAGNPAIETTKTKLNSLKTEIDKFGLASKNGAGALDFFKNALIGGGIIGGLYMAKNAITEFIQEANKLQAATLGLESVSKFKGIEPTVAVDSVKNLELVKNGLLTVGDASLALKNLLASNFTLEQSIELIKRFGDSAAFGRQAGLEFGYAITSATEGIKNGNSILVDNAGITKNLSIILKEAGFAEKDVMNVQSDLNIRIALYNGLLKESAAFLGDANKLTKTFAGEQAKLDAQVTTLKQNLGVNFQQALSDYISGVNNAGVSTKTLADIMFTAATAGIGWLKILTDTVWTTFPNIIHNIAKEMGLMGYVFETMLNPLQSVYGLMLDIYNLGQKPLEGVSKILPPSDADVMGGNYTMDYKAPVDTKIAKTGEVIKKNTRGGNRNGTSKTIAEITNEIIRLNKSLADLTAEQLSLGESAKGTSIFAIYLQQIQEIQDKLKYLNSPFKDSTGLDFITNLPKYDNSQNIQGQELSFAEQVNLTGIDKEAMQKEAYDKIVNGSQQALSNVESIFQILDIGTDTFVSKLVNGFQTTLSIIDTIKQVIESINTVKQGIGILGSLLSFVPGGGFIGTATAGIGTLGGGGRNIGNLSTGGGQGSTINKIYINSTLDTQKFFGDGVTTFYKNRNLNTVG